MITPAELIAANENTVTIFEWAKVHEPGLLLLAAKERKAEEEASNQEERNNCLRFWSYYAGMMAARWISAGRPGA